MDTDAVEAPGASAPASPGDVGSTPAKSGSSSAPVLQSVGKPAAKPSAGRPAVSRCKLRKCWECAELEGKLALAWEQVLEHNTQHEEEERLLHQI